MNACGKASTIILLIILFFSNHTAWADEIRERQNETITRAAARAIPTTIYEIQYSENHGPHNTFPSPFLDSVVVVTGVVTADHSVASDHFYIQDDADSFGTGGAWNGLCIYDRGDYNFSLGDKLRILGRVGEYGGRTELQPMSYSWLSYGNALPDPVELQTGDIKFYSYWTEQFEGVLVKVREVAVVDPDVGYGSWRIDDGSGIAQVDGGDQYTYEPKSGDYLEWIQGCLDYSYDEYEIELRGGEDIGELRLYYLCNNDNGAPDYVEEVGTWSSSNGTAICPGIDNLTSRYAIQSMNPGARATFTPDIPFSGSYSIEFALPLTAAASTNALYVIQPGGGANPDSVWFNQNSFQPCEWRLLGVYRLVKGRANSVSVINDGTGYGYVIRTDLMRFMYCLAVPVEPETPRAELPKTYALRQNYPNPFNARTEIRYQIPEDNHVTLEIFNTLGQKVRNLVDYHQTAGEYVVVWDGRDANGREMASGVYFCRLRAGNFSETVKMVLLQ
jgi:hypothetical protein